MSNLEEEYLKVMQCNDCSSTSVYWASINRGVLLCNECCSIHLNLGRHISEIKLLNGNNWRGKQSNLMKYLYNTSAHVVWSKNTPPADTKPKQKALLNREHHSESSLLGGMNKSSDIVREQNILMKYNELHSSKDGGVENMEVNMQLLACVRTSHVEVTLRLLSLGALASFAERDSGNTCMHIAAREGQDLQVELLFLFGADPAAFNKDGLTPHHFAISSNHNLLAKRLLEMKNHVIQEIASFVEEEEQKTLGKTSERDVLKVYLTNQSLEDSKHLNEFVSGCNDKQFMKILQDIYDEVERRKILADWQKLDNRKSFIEEKNLAAFLPSIASYSPTHNQYRQKMAKLNSKQLVLLIIHVLKECKQRSILSFRKNEFNTVINYGAVTEKPKKVEMEKSFSPRRREYSSENTFSPGVSSDTYDEIIKKDRQKLAKNRISLDDRKTNSYDRSLVRKSPTASLNGGKVTSSSNSFTTSLLADSFIGATEKLTSEIRVLVRAAQSEINTEIAEKCATQIGESVLELINCIPAEVKNERIVKLIDMLWDNIALLSCKCNSPVLRSDEVCSAAFDLAQTTKNLLSLINQ